MNNTTLELSSATKDMFYRKYIKQNKEQLNIIIKDIKADLKQVRLL